MNKLMMIHDEMTVEVFENEVDLGWALISESFQWPGDRTSDMRDEYSPAYNYSDNLLRGLLATEEWTDS